MPCTIVVGGQYGSEGKGKVVALLAGQLHAPWVVRCGGPNSGHTVSIGGKETVLRQVPAAADHPGATLLLSAGCIVDEDILEQEVDSLHIPRDRIIVDPRAVLVEEADRIQEEAALGYIGSTCSGTGAALIRRITRQETVRLAGDSERLVRRVRVEHVAPFLHATMDHGGHVIVEGTQGFGLSLLHGLHYPYVTSRDTTAAGFAAEVGLSPRQIDSVVMVIRTFPIRVGGPSGPLLKEISWQEVQRISKAPSVREEFTSVTKRLRRVGRFDIDAVKSACQYNRPTSLAIMGLDRLDYKNTDMKELDGLSREAVSFAESVQRQTGVAVTLVGTGFKTDQAVWCQVLEGVSHV